MSANPMSYRDFSNLAELLDRNQGFSRPDGQKVGFSLQEEGTEAPSSAACAATTVETNPASIPLPPAVVNHQLGLPVPSDSVEAKRKHLQKQRSVKPKGYDIWTEKELLDALNPVNRVSTKPREGAEEPEYDILFQEKVGAEDVFLGMDMTQSGVSALLVKVMMPKLGKLTDLSIDVDPNELRLSAPLYFLRASLPKKVIAGKADAKWDAQSQVLRICLEVDESERLF